jgi:hypothetical protein
MFVSGIHIIFTDFSLASAESRAEVDTACLP